MNVLKYFSIALLVSVCAVTQAQDIHFSQFYASPLTLNPAMSGFHDGTFRVAGIYRNQWRSVTTPFQTYGASFDMRLLQKKLKKDIFGVGGSIVYDKAGDGDLSNMGIMASASYHKALGKGAKHFIGIGLQGGFVQRNLNTSNLAFPSQYSNGTFDLTQPNGEQNLNDNTGYFDMNAGLLWSSKIGSRLGVFAGGTIFHLIPPTESFLDDDNKLSMRYLAHTGLNIKVTEHIYITPNFLFMHQNAAREINFGTALEYHFKDANNTIVSIGGWYRIQDAGIISASVEHRGIRMGVAYDVNTSPLEPASNNRGAFEIALIYIGNIKKVNAPILVPCPRL